MITTKEQLRITKQQAKNFEETIKKLEREQMSIRYQLEACRSILYDLNEEIKEYEKEDEVKP